MIVFLVWALAKSSWCGLCRPTSNVAIRSCRDIGKYPWHAAYVCCNTATEREWIPTTAAVHPEGIAACCAGHQALPSRRDRRRHAPSHPLHVAPGRGGVQVLDGRFPCRLPIALGKPIGCPAVVQDVGGRMTPDPCSAPRWHPTPNALEPQIG